MNNPLESDLKRRAWVHTASLLACGALLGIGVGMLGALHYATGKLRELGATCAQTEASQSLTIKGYSALVAVYQHQQKGATLLYITPQEPAPGEEIYNNTLYSLAPGLLGALLNMPIHPGMVRPRVPIPVGVVAGNVLFFSALPGAAYEWITPEGTQTSVVPARTIDQFPVQAAAQ